MARGKSEGAKDPDLVLAGKLVTDIKTCLSKVTERPGLAGNLEGAEVGLYNMIRTTKGNYQFKDRDALTAFVSKMSDLPTPSTFVQNNYEALKILSSGKKDNLETELQHVVTSNQGKYPQIYGKNNPEPTVPAVSEKKVNIESEKNVNVETDLKTNLQNEIKEFGKTVKTKDQFEEIQHTQAFTNNEAANKIVKLIDSKKFTPEKLINTVDKMVGSWGKEINNEQKQEYKDKILSAAIKLADSKGKFKEPKEPNVLLAEELANGMKDLWKAKEKQGSPIAGTQELLKDKNSPLLEFTNNKTGKVEFKDQEEVKKFSEKLNSITQQISWGNNSTTDLTLSNNNAVFEDLRNGKEPNPETLKTVKGTIDLNKTNNKSIPKKISSSLKNQAASIGKAALAQANKAKENVGKALNTVKEKVRRVR